MVFVFYNERFILDRYVLAQVLVQVPISAPIRNPISIRVIMAVTEERDKKRFIADLRSLYVVAKRDTVPQKGTKKRREAEIRNV